METWTIIILGATGDLSRSRLILTLYEIMQHQDDLSFVFIGAAKDEVNIKHLIRESIPDDSPLVEKLIARSMYQQVDFEVPETFFHLAQKITSLESTYHLSGNRLIYLSVASQWYCTATKLLTKYAIIEKKPYHRVVYEKPFGWDASSAKEIDSCLSAELTEEQIYRVDHYLTKALVTSLLLTRFSNVFFEPVWNSSYIDQIQITLTEKSLLDTRGTFYDNYGALKDVVQNHLLQLLSIIAMEKPATFDAPAINANKSTILRHTRITDGLLGQYASYQDVPGVAPNSTTDTYALLRAEISTDRWKGVPFFIKTGKALDIKSTEIHIVFKQQCPELSVSTGPFEPNRLIIRISPDSSILIRLNAQKRTEPEVIPISMEFCYRCTFGQDQPHSYEAMFYEIMRGDKSGTVTLDEIVLSWNIITQIQDLDLPLYQYQPGSSGPKKAVEFSRLYAINWDTGATIAKPSS